MLDFNNTLSVFKKSGIYIIHNSVDGRKYVGSSVNLHNRFKAHKSQFLKKKHHSYHLQNFVNKYGIESLSIEIVTLCPPEYCVKLEQWFLDNLKPEFNNSKKAGSTLGVKFSEEIRKRMSEQRKGKKLSPESYKKSGETRKKLGYKLSEEQKEKLRNANKGRLKSEETIEKIRITSTGRRHTEESKRKISEEHLNNKDYIQRMSLRMRGEGSNKAKLKESDIPEIRDLLHQGNSLSSIGKQYGVSHFCIKCIRDKKTWSHVL